MVMMMIRTFFTNTTPRDPVTLHFLKCEELSNRAEPPNMYDIPTLLQWLQKTRLDLDGGDRNKIAHEVRSHLLRPAVIYKRV